MNKLVPNLQVMILRLNVVTQRAQGPWPLEALGAEMPVGHRVGYLEARVGRGGRGVGDGGGGGSRMTVCCL